MKQLLKRLIFGLLGKDPEAIVVSFLTGEKASAMLEEVLSLLPDRRHFAVTLDVPLQRPGVTVIRLAPGSVWQLWRRLRRLFRPYRIGMAPVLFSAEAHYRPLRLAAFLLAPARILAYNARLERHHLRLRTAIASLLFLRGVPLDRIFIRPRWLFPFRQDRSVYPETWRVIEGRAPEAGRRRVAVVSPYIPWPLAHGGAVRIYHLLREAAREFDVYLFAFSEGAAEEYGPLPEFLTKIVLVDKPRYREPRWASLAPPEACEYRSPAMRRALRELSARWGIELVQLEYTHLATYRGHVLVAHDVTSDLFRQIHERQRSWSSWWNLWRWRRFELRAARRFARVVVMSQEDAQRLPGARPEVIPNGVDLERFLPEPEPAGRRVLFVGSFRHFPNAAAYRLLAEQIWPRVRASVPDAQLTVVAGPHPELYWREHTGEPTLPVPEGVVLLGFVHDVRPLYADCNVVVVPTPVSAGTNLKVLEAMAMQRAVVSTSCGCAGLGLRHGLSVWIADEPQEFAEGVVRLLGDRQLRARLAECARQLAVAHFDWRELGARQRSLWRELLRPAVRIRQARPDDLAELARIEVASPEAAMWNPREYLHYSCRVAEVEGKVAGFLVWRVTSPGEAEILNLAVWPERRRLGIATRLLESVLATPGYRWFLEVRESNHPARRLYEKMGFREVGRRPSYYQDTGEAAVVMRRDS
ncbi:MAG: GNAT family N-acetyltransferase [Bryobacterales bacterium]|nr:GNAT family N-acetyltransferase [Bryobacteraceae bacterium]MDW8129758.1 GNAT family N-acetyltransferase [Bryobacterales bacterium]